MSCRRIEEYIEGGLSRPERERFSRHLKSCPGCRRRLKLVRELRGLKPVEANLPPEGYWDSFWPRLREKVRAEDAAARRKFYHRVLLRRIKPAYSAAVVAVLAAVILTVILKNHPAPPVLTPTPFGVTFPTRPKPADFVLARAGGQENCDYICSPAGPRSENGPAGDSVLSGPHRSRKNEVERRTRFDRVRTACPRYGGHSYVFALGCLSPGPGGVIW